MKPFVFLFVALAIFLPERQLAQTRVESSRLGKDFVIIGELGVPLGTVTEIDASIVSGRSLGSKGLTSDYLLKVTKVGTNSIAKSPTCRFQTHDVKIASDVFALYELKNGKKPGTLSNTQITELERGYVGRAFHLLAYEEGMFTGVPQNLPADSVSWQDEAFGFRSHLIVLRVFEEPGKPKM